MAKATITHIIFDFDGTLVDTVDKGTDILDEYIFDRFNVHITPNIREYVPNLESLDWLAERINIELGIQVRGDELLHQWWPQVYGAKYSLMPGVERLVKHLHQQGVPMAVATGNSSKHYQAISSRSHFEEFFQQYMHHNICAWDDDRVIRKKPFPDVYQVCIDAFDTPPASVENVLIIEDSITGLKGAIDSGARTLFVVNKHPAQVNDATRPVWEKAVEVLDTLEDFKPENYSLPSFE